MYGKKGIYFLQRGQPQGRERGYFLKTKEIRTLQLRKIKMWGGGIRSFIIFPKKYTAIIPERIKV